MFCRFFLPRAQLGKLPLREGVNPMKFVNSTKSNNHLFSKKPYKDSLKSIPAAEANSLSKTELGTADALEQSGESDHPLFNFHN
ncbi:hypothetical protein [Aquicella lusitana]|uniref:Uncharacterized protein n=1 Tax=Aquicella lusitana TaxID=254246 RepID=A0A370G5P6_9COXI|nr:hypothetical protein [Aquicella lusitana]RDI39085.1 hypothetical protein C8D86_12810 [Aquicella lusitana]VVC73484.1 hypothetical protein AQULUS_12240 [Aquicella lusitana]